MSRVTILAITALLGLAACGDDTSSTSNSVDPSTVESVTAADPTVAETAPSDTAPGDTASDDTFPLDTFPVAPADPNAPGIGSEFCAVSDELNASDFDPFSATPAEVEAFFNVEFADMFGRLQAATPAELTDDVETVGNLYGILIAELEANGWDVNAAFEIPEVQAAMTGEEISTAGGNLDAYCGL
mgnify:FL=1